MNNLEKKFIDALIDDTNSGLLNWSYLDENPTLAEKINFRIPEDFKDDCFYFENENSFFIITHYYEYDDYDPRESTDEYMLYIIPDTFRNIKRILSTGIDENYEILMRLDNVIKNTFPNPEDIMTTFIHGKK